MLLLPLHCLVWCRPGFKLLPCCLFIFLQQLLDACCNKLNSILLQPAHINVAAVLMWVPTWPIAYCLI